MAGCLFRHISQDLTPDLGASISRIFVKDKNLPHFNLYCAEYTEYQSRIVRYVRLEYPTLAAKVYSGGST